MQLSANLSSSAAGAYDNELEIYKQRCQQFEEKQLAYENQINRLKNNVIEFKNKYLEIKERYDLLVYKRYMRSAEQSYDNKQPSLFTPETEPVEIEDCEEDAFKDEAEKTKVASYTRSKRGRKPIDPKLTREERTIDIPEKEKICACGTKLTKIGEETSEKLEVIEPRVYVDRIVRPKYACRSCEGTEDEDKPAVRIAPVEPSMIPRSIASASLLSVIFTHKFEDHLPYYRQEKQFERIGVEISRQDLSNWQQHVYKKLTPLFELILNRAA
jgi:transposase